MRKTPMARLVLYLSLAVAAAALSLPFYYMIVTSLKPTEEVTSIPVRLTLENPTLRNYRELLGSTSMLRTMWNSFVIAALLTLGNLILCPLAGYSFAKHRFPGKETLFTGLLATMMIPASVLLIPGFLLFRDLGWLNTWAPLIVPGLAGVFGVFLSRQFIAEIPDDLIDAARIDGCNEFQIFRHVTMPLSKALLATLAILTFLGSWNSFIGPLIYLLDEDKFTLPLLMALLQGRFTAKENIQMAGAFLSILPVLLVFMMFQKHIVKSLATSGLKG